MTCRGVHFALTPTQERSLPVSRGEEHVRHLIEEQFMETWTDDSACELDKTWDAIHRCLACGPLEPDGTPLGKCVLGGQSLHRGNEYIIRDLAATDIGAARAYLTDPQEFFSGTADRGQRIVLFVDP